MTPYPFTLLNVVRQVEATGLADWKWVVVGAVMLAGLLAALGMAIAERRRTRRALRLAPPSSASLEAGTSTALHSTAR